MWFGVFYVFKNINLVEFVYILYVCVSKIWGCVNVIKFYMINLFE